MAGSGWIEFYGRFLDINCFLICIIRGLPVAVLGWNLVKPPLGDYDRYNTARDDRGRHFLRRETSGGVGVWPSCPSRAVQRPNLVDCRGEHIFSEAGRRIWKCDERLQQKAGASPEFQFSFMNGLSTSFYRRCIQRKVYPIHFIVWLSISSIVLLIVQKVILSLMSLSDGAKICDLLVLTYYFSCRDLWFFYQAI